MFSDSIWRLLAGSLELSQREFQILQAVFDDQKESAIAANLGISSHTVHTHLERLYHKLGRYEPRHSRFAGLRRVPDPQPGKRRSGLLAAEPPPGTASDAA